MEKEKNSFKPSEKVTVEKGKLVVGTDEDTGITVCEKDCEFMGYDSSSSRVVCRCDSRNKIFSVSDLNSNDLIFFFDNIVR